MTLIFDNIEYNNILDGIKINNKVNCNNICSICRDPLLLDTIILNCKHIYHSTCIKDSFHKYESKKCPLCQELILWDSYKTKCIVKKTNNIICNKLCYNNEQMCTLHINTNLRMLEKEKNNKNNKINLLNSKKYKLKINQLNKLKIKVAILENEISLLQDNII